MLAIFHLGLSPHIEGFPGYLNYQVILGDGQTPLLQVQFADKIAAEHYLATVQKVNPAIRLTSELQLFLTLTDIERLANYYQIKLTLPLALKVRDNYTPYTSLEVDALKVISEHRAIVKVIPDFDYDPYTDKIFTTPVALDFIFDQVANPTTNRPSHSQYLFGDKLPNSFQKLNLLTKKVHTHYPSQCRKRRHKDVEYQHTLKTATSLYPPGAISAMEVFDEGCIGFLWDSNDCKIKDKYIFKCNAGSSSAAWLNVENAEINQLDHIKYYYSILVSMQKLRDYNNQAVADKAIIEWNEVVVGLPRQKLTAIFVAVDTLNLRLRSVIAMRYIQQKLGIKQQIPLLIMEKGCPIRIYTQTEQALDWRCYNNSYSSLFIEKGRKRQQDLPVFESRYRLSNKQ